MDTNYIEIILYGYYFYINASRVRDLAFIDGKLVNISDTTINMAENFNSTNNNYPRITCSAMQPCVIRINNQYSQIVDERYQLANPNFNMNTLSQNGFNTILITLLSIIVALKLLFKK